MYDEKEKMYVDVGATGIHSLAVRTKKEEDLTLPKIMGNLSMNEQRERDLLPLYRETSKLLPNTDILISKNTVTGIIGMYIFDRSVYRFIQVVLPDIDYKKGKENIPHRKFLFLTMSTKTSRAISIQYKPEGGVEKYEYDGKTSIFNLMEEESIIDSEEKVEELIKGLEDDPCHSREGVAFLKGVKQFVVHQKNGKNLIDGAEVFNQISPPSDTSTDTEEEEEEEKPLSSDTSSSDDSSEDDSFEIIDEVNCQ